MAGDWTETGAKMNALDLWDALAPYNWAVKPAGTVFPYFCQILKGDSKPVKVRFVMLEGWQTLHEYLHVRADVNFGFYSVPMEFAHLELVVLADGGLKLLRYDTGYMPVDANESQAALASRILWEAYGVMLRMETDPKLPMKYASDQAMFARVESAPGKWEDSPLAIPPPRPHVEKISFSKDDIKSAKDLPMVKELKYNVDFRIIPGLMTKEQRPRTVYQLVIDEEATGHRLVDSRVSILPEGGLKSMWEAMPSQVLKEIVRLGRVPGELRVVSGRVFRMLRPLCLELPFRLSLHDSIPSLR